MAHSLESYDSADSGSEISEIDDVEILNNAAAEIVPWRFEPRGRPRDERLHFDRENEESKRKLPCGFDTAFFKTVFRVVKKKICAVFKFIFAKKANNFYSGPA